MFHLARRFFSSLRPGAIDEADESWLLGLLTSAEQALYEQQPFLDRRHAVECAAFVRANDGDARSEVVVASALHDVGKAQARLGTLGRVGATVMGKLLSDSMAHAWSLEGGLRGRVGLYLEHDALGAEMLEAARSHRLVVAWAREHHWAEAGWSMDPAIGSILLAADQ